MRDCPAIKTGHRGHRSACAAWVSCVSKWVLQCRPDILLWLCCRRTGFIRTIKYTDQFYAARVFTNLPAGRWTELAYTLSETIYDPTTPTAKITGIGEIHPDGQVAPPSANCSVAVHQP